MKTLRGKKDEYQGLKETNNRIRAQIIRERKMADMFKVTGLKKREEFLPALKLKGNF
jgi:hypothetical protein